MAAGIFNQLVRDRNIHGAHAESAGTHAYDGLHATPQAVGVSRAGGVDIRRHRSRCVTAELAERSDLILTMTGQHWYDVTELAQRDKVRLLTSFTGDGEDIADPFGGSVEVYREVFERLKGYLEGGLTEIVAAAGGQAST